MNYRYLGLFAAGLCLGITPAQAASNPGEQSADRLESGAFDVGVQSHRLMDLSRPTDANGRKKAKESRQLDTRIWYPAEKRALEALRPGPAPVAEGEFPLIVYSHGFMSFKTEGQHLAEHLASHGYIVVAADFPLTNYFAPGGSNLMDVVNQPGDVSFLIDTLLAWDADEKNAFYGAVDEAQIGAAGLSLGGLTTTLVSYHPQLRDARIKAAVNVAGPAFFFGSKYFEGKESPHYLVIAGGADALIPPEHNADPLEERAPLSTIITIENGSHLGFAYYAAPWFALHYHPDRSACRMVGRRVNSDDESTGEMLSVGDASDGILQDVPAHFCEIEEWPKALSPRRQLNLEILAARAFLDTHLQNEAVSTAAQTYFQESFAAENPEVTVKFPRVIACDTGNGAGAPSLDALLEADAANQNGSAEGGALLGGDAPLDEVSPADGAENTAEKAAANGGSSNMDAANGDAANGDAANVDVAAPGGDAAIAPE